MPELDKYVFRSLALLEHHQFQIEALKEPKYGQKYL